MTSIILPHTDLLNTSLIKQADQVWVALSGGVDSIALLHIAYSAYKLGWIQALQAIHIHHGLQKNANKWASFCQTYCQTLKINCVIQKITLTDLQRNIEQQARVERYKVFAHAIQKNHCLLMGHHQNDQAETVLFRAARGSDVYGLKGIPETREMGKGTLSRPFLSISRAGIIQYANNHQLKWIEDPSNAQLKQDRNFIRNQVLPLLEDRWPHIRTSLSQVAQHAHWVQSVLNEVAIQDFKTIEQTLTLPFLGSIQALYWPDLIQLSQARQINCILQWLRQNQCSLLNIKNTLVLMNELIQADLDKQPYITCHGGKLRRYGAWLIIDKHLPISSPVTEGPFKVHHLKQLKIFQNKTIIIKKNQSPQGQGLAIRHTELTITSRLHAQHLNPFELPNRKGRKTLKKWLYELKVPYWIRDQIPILIDGQDIVMIPTLAINVKFTRKSHEDFWEFSLQN